jgi:Zn-dependent M28 family amino/carboxypeptidase
MNKNKGRSVLELRRAMSAMLVSLLIFGQIFAQTVAPAKAVLAAEEQDLAAKIDIQTIKDVTATLASDEMEGRGTMQPGGDKAANWIADRFKALGLKPLGDKGSYLQKIDFKETAPTAETTLTIGDEKLNFGTDFSLLPMNNGNTEVSGEMVFVGYGIQVKAINRDDLKGVDVMGKIVVLFNGYPSVVTKKEWNDNKATSLFRQNLIQKGAAAVVYVGNGTEDSMTEESISYFSRRQITMPNEAGFPSGYAPYIYIGAKAAEKLFAKSGVTLKDAAAQAETNAFKPFKLNQKAKLVAKYKTTKGISNNVVGYIEGTDAKLKEEAVLFSAHYDAYGKEGDKIYHGAADNALGTAEMLAVAEAFSKSPNKPKRSLVFLAVTGEEYGLYGSAYWAKKPTWDIKKVAGNLNLDGIGTEVYGPVKTFVGFGAEHSTIGTILDDVSAAFGIKVIPDPMPDEKIFYRSDHYSFVTRGVPALMLLGAPEGDPQKWIDRSKLWEKTDYHQPGDVIQKDWSWEGAKTVADVMGIMGLRLANADTMPAWLGNSRFAKLERGNTKDVPEEK